MEKKVNSNCIQVFARAPVAGQVKTRIAARIGPEPALSLYQAMFHRTIEQVNQVPLSHRELWITGNPDDPMFAAVKPEFRIFTQQGKDLGERMRFALQQGLTRYTMVILIGTDCPTLDALYLESAIEALNAGNKVVFGPAEDGGYVLLGLTVMVPGLFEALHWGTDTVLQISQTRLKDLSLPFKLLKPLRDIDRPEDLPGLATLSPPLVY
ncbi:MAG: TIGR04282 family arsenosugar biosynthesis glycosyltransferase [Pseudohongiellaceae bacterium]